MKKVAVFLISILALSIVLMTVGSVQATRPGYVAVTVVDSNGNTVPSTNVYIIEAPTSGPWTELSPPDTYHTDSKGKVNVPLDISLAYEGQKCLVMVQIPLDAEQYAGWYIGPPENTFYLSKTLSAKVTALQVLILNW